MYIKDDFSGLNNESLTPQETPCVLSGCRVQIVLNYPKAE